MIEKRIPFGRRIIVLRRRKGWTQRRLAQEMGMNDSHALSHWESGRNEPSLYNFFRLCKTLGVSPDEFMEGVDYK